VTKRPPESAQQFYTALADAFEQVHGDATTPPLFLDAPKTTVRIRCTSLLLREQISRPLTHLEIAATPVPPGFTIDALDVASTAIEMPRLPWQPQRFSVEQQTGEYQAGPYLFTLHGDAVLTAQDTSSNRTLLFVRNARNWPPEHYKQALFIIFYQHLRHRALHLIHASCVARQHQALLITGSSGAGKTTTMLACVRAGFDFLSDDTTLAQQTEGGRVKVLSLLNTLNATERTLAWFPELEPYAAQQANPMGKRLIMINEAYPDRLGSWGEVQAILVPQITDQAQPSLTTIGKAELLREMLPYSLDLHDAAFAHDQLGFLADLVESVASYRLLLGTNWQRLPRLMDKLLDQAQ
jgi:hypothetical protein